MILFLLISRAETAQAGSHTKGDRAKIYVLRGDSMPSVVLPEKDAKNQHGTFMRMPDIGHEGEGAGELSHKGHDKLKARNGHGLASDLVPPLQSQLGSAKKPLRFSASKISGTWRLPRVKFARVGVPMENRDELPSLDFTQRSLKESGF